MPSSGYVADTFVAGEQPTTAKWNELWGNDASFNSGAGFNDGIIVSRHIATGAVTFADLLSTIFSGQVTSATNAGTGGGDTNFLNLGGLKLCWGLTANCANVPTNGTSSLGIIFPTTYAAAPKFYVSIANVINDSRLIAQVETVSTTIAGITIASAAAGSTANAAAYWLAIGT